MENELFQRKNAILDDHLPESEALASSLNKVIAKTLNSREEFLTFAGKAQSRTLYQLCMDVKQRRDDFALSLQRYVTSIGFEPATEENFTGWIHHLWSRTRLTLESEPDYVIASEAVREEESMVLALKESLEISLLTGDLVNLLEQEIEFSLRLKQMMEELKIQLKPDDYVDVNR